MTICQNCGAQVPDGVRFCAACGAPIARPVPPPAAIGPHGPQGPNPYGQAPNPYGQGAPGPYGTSAPGPYGQPYGPPVTVALARD